MNIALLKVVPNGTCHVKRRGELGDATPHWMDIFTKMLTKDFNLWGNAQPSNSLPKIIASARGAL